MKLELERSGFLKVWQVAEKYTPSKTTMEALNGIRITAGSSGTVTLEATDLKSSVKCPAKGAEVIEPGVAVLNSAIFGNMLKKASAKTITLEVSGSRGTLTAGGSKSRFAVIAPETFPNIQASSGAEEICTIQASDLGKLINEGSCAASAPSDFPKYMGTCLLRTAEKLLLAVATDGRRLSCSRKPAESVSKETDLLLPAASLKDLAKVFTGDETVRILFDGSMVWFILEKPEQNIETSSEDVNTESVEEETSNEDENIQPAEDAEAPVEDAKPAPAPKESYLDGAEFSLRSIEATFPRYERILNEEVKTSMTIGRTYLLSALDRIAVIAKNNPSQIMAMELKPEFDLRITARAPGLGTASETLMPEEVDGERMQIGYNINFLNDGLKAAGSPDVYLEFSDVEGQTRIFRSKDDKDFMYMLMPLRLSPQDLVDEDDNSDFDTPEDDNAEPQQKDSGNEAPQESSDNSDAPF